MRKNVVTFLFALSVVAGWSCGPYAPKTVSDPIQDKEKVLLLDHGMKFYLNVVRHRLERMESGQTQVKLEIQNEEDKDVWTDIQVVFRGKDGFEVERTEWEPFQFHRRALTTYQKVSFKSNVEDYRISIRNPK